MVGSVSGYNNVSVKFDIIQINHRNGVFIGQTLMR